MSTHDSRSALRVALLYAIFAFLWIYLSDTLLGLWLTDPEEMTRFEMYKGWLFVAVTASILYSLFRIELRHRRRAEDSLRESEEKFRRMANATSAAIFIIDGRSLKHANRAAEDLTGLSITELRARPAQDIMHPDDRKSFLEHLGKASLPMRHEFRILRKDGNQRWVDFTASLIQFEGRAAILGTAFDITDRKAAQESLTHQEELLRTILETLPVGVWLTDDSGKILDGNKAGIQVLEGERLVGLHDHAEYNAWWHGSGKRITPEERALYRAITQGQTSLDEVIDIECSNGKRKTILNSTVPIHGPSGAITGAVVVNQDITEREKAEERIKSSLREKEVLLKEIHHRVKNNMQVISSLLSLQADLVKDQKYLALFRESQHRVRSMALIHEMLYQSPNLARINFADYIRDLAESLVRTYGLRNIHLLLDVAPVSFDIDAAIPCGLILNELVSNALKYAFPNGNEGTITIALQPLGNGRYFLRVADDGVGMPDGLDFRESPSLGMQLAVTLTEQLNGTIELDTRNGTAFTITFAPETGQ